MENAGNSTLDGSSGLHGGAPGTIPQGGGPVPEPSIAMSRYVARLMDMSLKVPGTGFHVGLDAVIGLVPYVGDVVTGAAGSVILIDAARHKAPPELMGKMIMNLGADVIGGAAIPVAGDLFDLVWKANKKNLTLLEDHLNLPRTFGKQQAAAESRWRPNAGGGGFGGGGSVGGAHASGQESSGQGLFGGQAPRAPGEASIDTIDSRFAAKPVQLIRATFITDKVGRRTETKVWGSGGGGTVHGYGGNLSGYTNPVTIHSRTNHDNEIWFRTPNGAEMQVVLNADQFQVRDGQKVSLVFARNGKSDRDTLVSATNHSARDTQAFVATDKLTGTFPEICGGKLSIVTYALIGLFMVPLALLILSGNAKDSNLGGVVITLAIAFVGAVIGIFFYGRKLGMMRKVVEEAKAFAQGGHSA